MPHMQRDIVTELLRARADVEAVDAISGTATLPADVTARAVDVVILGRDDPATARALLEASPRLVVLSVADDELIAWRYGLTPFREPLGELSPAVLTAAIEHRDPLPSWWAKLTG
jgi:hypothetical protein